MSRKTVFTLFLVLTLLLPVGMSPASAAPAAQPGAAYTIKLGDTLWLLAEKYLGTGTAWPAIMALTNQKNIADTTFARIENADLIYPGWKLWIPTADEAKTFLATYTPAKPELLFGKRAKGQLVVGSWWTSGGEFAGLNEMFKLYKAANPDVEIVNAAIAGGAGTNFKGQLLSQLIGGVAPDSFQLHAGLEIEMYSPGVYVVPVDDIYTANGFDKVFPADLLTLLKYKDRYWGVPVNIHRANVLWYNKALFAKAGIANPPTTWDEFFAAADKLKAAGITPVALGSKDAFELQHTFETILIGTLGADGYRGLWTGKTSWKDAKVTDALNILKRYISYANTDYAALGWANATALIINSKAAMNIMGDWANGEFVNAKFTDYGWAPVPGNAGIFDALSDSFALPAKAPNTANAKAWLALAGSKAAQEKFNALKGSICARTDCDPAVFGAYGQSAMKDWASNKIVPSVVHGAAAVPSWVKGYSDAVTLFVTSGDVAAAQAALVKAATDAGFKQ